MTAPASPLTQRSPTTVTAKKKSSYIVSRHSQYLYRRRNIFYFRHVLPLKLQDRFHRTDVRLSLKTPYHREAAKRA